MIEYILEDKKNTIPLSGKDIDKIMFAYESTAVHIIYAIVWVQPNKRGATASCPGDVQCRRTGGCVLERHRPFIVVSVTKELSRYDVRKTLDHFFVRTAPSTKTVYAARWNVRQNMHIFSVSFGLFEHTDQPQQLLVQRLGLVENPPKFD